MLFITESDLRDQFKLQPITKFKLPPDTKLTPGARQFLLDRGVDLYDENQNDNQKSIAKKDEEKIKKPSAVEAKLRLLHAETLLVATDFIGKDISVVQEISRISRFVLSMMKYIQCKVMTENLEYKSCSHISEDDFSKDVKDCFEINDFYIQVENGKEILTLHRLRVLFRSFCEELDDYQFESEDVRLNVKKYLCQIVNTVSGLICTIHGSKQCLR